MNQSDISSIIRKLRGATQKFVPPLIDQIIKEYGSDPFLILVSCLLSLRSKDSATIHICRKLFEQAQTPQQILRIKIEKLEKILFTLGFYRNKAQVLHHVSRQLLNRFNGKVPCNQADLMSIKGIGSKTANLVLGIACNIPAICVDIHVHRISNRLGLVKTRTPEKTEEALKRVLPETYWIIWNTLLVVWGQNVCVPISPYCSRCAIRSWCKRVGVTKRR
jgi:endonuclease-3